jgi:hypothetical protein
MIYRGPGFLAGRMIDLASLPPSPLLSVSSTAHTERPRKKHNLLTEDGGKVGEEV